MISTLKLIHLIHLKFLQNNFQMFLKKQERTNCPIFVSNIPQKKKIGTLPDFHAFLVQIWKILWLVDNDKDGTVLSIVQVKDINNTNSREREILLIL